MGLFDSLKGLFGGNESIPETLLLDFSTASIVGALSSRDATPHELEGAARLLAGWPFNQARKTDRQLVPNDLRQKLRAHVSASPIADNRARFAAAFPD